MQTDGVNLKFIQSNLLWKQKSFHKIDIQPALEYLQSPRLPPSTQTSSSPFDFPNCFQMATFYFILLWSNMNGFER